MGSYTHAPFTTARHRCGMPHSVPASVRGSFRSLPSRAASLSRRPLCLERLTGRAEAFPNKMFVQKSRLKRCPSCTSHAQQEAVTTVGLHWGRCARVGGLSNSATCVGLVGSHCVLPMS